MNVAIVGAGIGGLAAAILLRRAGHDVVIFEQFVKPAPVGSGLVIQPVGLKVLDCLGIGDAARALGARIDRLHGRSATTGRRVLDVHYGAVAGLGIHRATLFDLLFKAALDHSPELRTDMRISTHRDGRLVSENGRESEVFDLIIDASGAGSRLSPLKARPLSFGAIWGAVDWVENGLSAAELSQRYRRADRMIGILPVGQLPGGSAQKVALFWSLPREGHVSWLAGGIGPWRNEAITLWPELAPFIEQITSAEQMTMARYGHGSLRQPYGPGIAYIGDAAHRASPQLGQGANMALLDAYALVRALQLETLQKSLELYAQARRWHVGLYQLASALLTPAYQSDSRVLPFVRDNLLFPMSMVPPVSAVLSLLVAGTILRPTGNIPI